MLEAPDEVRLRAGVLRRGLFLDEFTIQDFIALTIAGQGQKVSEGGAGFLKGSGTHGLKGSRFYFNGIKIGTAPLPMTTTTKRQHRG